MPELFHTIRQLIIPRLEKNLDPGLLYHNVGHTLDVLRQAELIAREEGINTDKDLLLLKTAALYHDSGFLFIYKNHEEKSCEIARSDLEDFFEEPDLKKICGMIMATKIPQSPHNLPEQIICDADLDYLGRDDFEPVSTNLYREFITFGILNGDESWDHIQIRFFEAHHYFTRTIIEKRNGKKLEHLQQLKQRSGWNQ